MPRHKRPERCVIYAMKCSCNLAYVGKTEFRITLQRWHNHLYWLRQGNHQNPYLQKHFNTFGQSHFWWEELESHPKGKLTKDEASQLEYDWICKLKSYSPEHGFNVNRITINKKSLDWPDIANVHADWGFSDKQIIASRQRMVERNKRQWKDPAFRKKVHDGVAKYWSDPANHKKHSIEARARNRRKRFETTGIDEPYRTHCIIDGCNKLFSARDRCKHHYRIWYREHKRNKQ